MTTEFLRLGVIGLGNIARQHIGHIQAGEVPNCKLTAVCSRSGHDEATELGVQHFAEARSLIDSRVCDAVLIATPSYTHKELGTAALQAGLHVMMEKPIGLSVSEGQQMLDATGPGQVFAVMLNQRTDPLFTAMRDIINQGTLGNITRTHWTMTNWFRPEVYFQVSDWRATWRGEGGGLLVNQCIHNLDIFQWLCGMPEKVHAFCRFGHSHDIEVEDEVTAYLEYANGASGVFVGSTGEAPGVNRLDIIGDQGVLSFDGEKLSLTENSQSSADFSRTTRDMFGMPDAKRREITVGRTLNQHALLLSNFARSILDGEQLIAPATEGLASLELANAMLLSTWEKRAVDIPLDAENYQTALQQRIAQSKLRTKADIDVHIDMDASYR